jgi:L-ribulose-5-phosphate 3-epimerase
MGIASRREFLKTVAGAASVAGLGASGLADSVSAFPVPATTRLATASGASSIKKGLVYGMLPKKLSHAERCKLARDSGFEVVQAPTTPDEKEADAIKKAAEAASLRIDSVMNMAHWDFPLSSADAAVVEKSLAGARTSLQNAKLWGSDVVLIVPAVVNAQTSYRDAWTRSQAQIRKLIPLAQELSVVIGIEEVWNKFLLSPLEMAAYIDEFKSPTIQAWFDVGNVVLYGYPQDWIRTLGKRIVKLHVKDFKRKENGYEWVNLGDGDVDWAAVRQSLSDINYSGNAIAELAGGDSAEYFQDVSRRMDRLILGKS